MKTCNLALLIFGCLLSAGCTTQTEMDSPIPWDRPDNWEYRIPCSYCGSCEVPCCFGGVYFVERQDCWHRY